MKKKDQDVVQLRFQVRDTGMGIPENRMDRLFKSFSQVDASTTRRYGGTGLGLVISKRLIELMGGRIGVESIVGHGSTFWFTAEFKTQTDKTAAEISASEEMFKDKRILVVDGNKTGREVLCTYLHNWGCSCSTASTAFEALQMMRTANSDKVSYDLAIIDQIIPGMDGKALGAAIKADPDLADTTLLLLMSYANPNDATEMQATGFDTSLRKPVKQSALFDCLATLFGCLTKRSHPLHKTNIRSKPPDASGHKIHILVVEDNSINQKVAVKMLDAFGFQTGIASNGKEALEALQKGHYDIVLMDIHMPEMDGYEATRQIRQSPSGTIPKEIPVIAMTANAMKGDREKCLAAGMDDYISKPINPRELNETLVKWGFKPADCEMRMVQMR
jgi:CheY-like chemotaxis protein